MRYRPRGTNDLKDFRILVIDTHPLMPTGDAVRSAIGRLADRLDKSGARVARASTSLPDLANSARLYMKLLNAARSPRLTPAALAEAQGVAAALSPDDRSLQAERARGWGMIHREWLATDAARLQLQQRWQQFFREFDAVIYPAAAVPAFPHDQSEPFDARQLDIDGKLHNLRRCVLHLGGPRLDLRTAGDRRTDRANAVGPAGRGSDHRALSRGPHDDCARPG